MRNELIQLNDIIEYQTEQERIIAETIFNSFVELDFSIKASTVHKTLLELDQSQWSRWYRRNITESDELIENIDYIQLDINVDLRYETKDFILSEDGFNIILMKSQTKAGKMVRQFFIKIKNKLKEVYKEQNNQLPKTEIEWIEYALETKKNELRLLEDNKEKDKEIISHKKTIYKQDDVIENILTYKSDGIRLVDYGRILSRFGLKGSYGVLNNFLRSKGIMHKRGTTINTKYLNNKWFDRIEEPIYIDNCRRNKTDNHITKLGQIKVYNLLVNDELIRPGL